MQEGGHLPGPESGLLSTLRNELSEEIHVLTKEETIGKGLQEREKKGEEPRRTALPRVHSLRFYQFFLVARAPVSQDGCQRG